MQSIQRPRDVLVAVLVVVCLTAGWESQSMANQERPAEGPERTTVLNEIFLETPEPTHFSETFLAQVPINTLRKALEPLSRLGDFMYAELDENITTLCFSKGYAIATVIWDENNRIQAFRITGLSPHTEDLKEAVDKFLALPGSTSIAVRKNRKRIVGERADTPLSVGSAFKLAVLRALETQVTTGRMKWSDVLTLTEVDKSLPTGLMHKWPSGLAVTAEATAVLMTSQSDNTATDLLIRHLGRTRVERFTPGNRPLLSTREAFLLRSPALDAMRESYLAAPTAGRRKILEQIGTHPAPEQDSFELGTQKGIGWSLSTDHLARLLEDSMRKDLLAVGDVPFATEGWSDFAYKGGSAPGVVNMTLWLKRGPDEYALSLTQNAEPQDIDHQRFAIALNGIVAQLRPGRRSDERCQSPSSAPR